MPTAKIEKGPIRLTQLVLQQLDATIITCWSVSKSQDILVLESVQLKPKNEWIKIADRPLRNFADCGVNFFVAEVAQTFCHCLDLSWACLGGELLPLHCSISSTFIAPALFLPDWMWARKLPAAWFDSHLWECREFHNPEMVHRIVLNVLDPSIWRIHSHDWIYFREEFIQVKWYVSNASCKICVSCFWLYWQCGSNREWL